MYLKQISENFIRTKLSKYAHLILEKNYQPNLAKKYNHTILDTQNLQIKK